MLPDRDAANKSKTMLTYLALFFAWTSVVTKVGDTLNDFHPLAYVASLADKDTMNLTQALNKPDADKFLEAMDKEVNDHVQRKHWKIVSKKDMRRSGYNGQIIMAVWSFKRKRNPFAVRPDN